MRTGSKRIQMNIGYTVSGGRLGFPRWTRPTVHGRKVFEASNGSNSRSDASAQAGIIPSVQYSEDCESGVTEKPIDGGAQQESK